MAQFELLMPKMGESITEATILKWLKKEGDSIALDEAVLEIATDKVDSEVPSPVAGVLTKVMFKENDVVAVGTPLAIIETEASMAAAPAATPAPAPVAEAAPSPTPVAATVAPAQVAAPVSQGDRFYSPLVLNIAKQEGIGMAELETIPGTGAEGRLTKKDILSYVSQRGQAPAAAVAAPAPIAAAVSTPSAAPAPNPAPAPISINGREEIIEMDRMRKMIGENMVKAKQIAPHVTSFVEADVTNIVKWRDKVKGSFEKKYGTKLTFTPIFMEAIIKAIKDYPMINVSVQGDKIIKKNYINLGMAAALPSGNLIVPVIHDADFLNLPGLAAKVNDLANRARTNKLKPEEIQGGTYTLTNVGSFGNWMGTPIIPQPQVAILAVGAIIKKPAVIETPEGDMIAVRHKMFLSHSYDHRVVDGALGGMFVRRVADYLEQWDVSRDS
jgi:2-oxoglutarate dehydrogenase E2 component (dihydrolipoamide succinyltransferase)